jgi:hypothetical protein
MRFRSKIVEIDAVQYAHGKVDSDTVADWFWDAMADRRITAGDDDTLLIATLEGTMKAQRGDWIIRGTEGELYPCKPSVFETKYEAA